MTDYNPNTPGDENTEEQGQPIDPNDFPQPTGEPGPQPETPVPGDGNTAPVPNPEPDPAPVPKPEPNTETNTNPVESFGEGQSDETNK